MLLSRPGELLTLSCVDARAVGRREAALRRRSSGPCPFAGTPTSTGIIAGLPAGLLWETDTLFVCDTQNGQVRQYDDTFTLVD